MNTYGYVGGNPLYWIDPYGLESVTAGSIAKYFNPTKFLIPTWMLGRAGPYVVGIMTPTNAQGVGECPLGAGSCGPYFNEDAKDKEAENCPPKGRVKNPPDVGPPDGYAEGPRRGREYGPDGKPIRDYDNPHQGADYPHVHEWPNGVREEPGRPYSPVPKKE